MSIVSISKERDYETNEVTYVKSKKTHVTCDITVRGISQNMVFSICEHSFSAYSKFSEKLTFLFSPHDTHTFGYVCVSGGRKY